MYAVVEIGGHQYKVSEGDVLFVDKQSDETGQELTFDKVLLINDGDGKVTVGTPVVEGASVSATLLDNVKSDKVMVFKKKRRKGYRVKRGHRQQMSRIEIEDITVSGAKKKSAKKSTKKKSAEKKSAKKKEEPKKAEAKAETKSKAKAEPKKKESKAKGPDKVSTDMNAKEAIEIIKNTPLDQLKGFVPDDEDRVTVQRAWKSKQEED